jgi:hypothetical protein
MASRYVFNSSLMCLRNFGRTGLGHVARICVEVGAKEELVKEFDIQCKNVGLG